MLTRPQFDQACKLLIAKYATSPSFLSTNAMKGWSWIEHPSVSGLGYMCRTAIYIMGSSTSSADPLSEEASEEMDEATATILSDASEVLTSRQFVVFSATFQVPCFYFTMYHSNGTPLSLDELISTSLFRPCVVEGSETSAFAITRPTSAFPLLSQGDHPTTGSPCWYLHPCETTAAVEELLQEVEVKESNVDSRLLQWLEKWFCVLGAAVSLSQ